jgi:hypothetical protein
MTDGANSFPIQLAIRTLLDNVSYSNALPDWTTPLVIDYEGRENRIRATLDKYIAGEPPEKTAEISVPKKVGKPNIWVVPSVNDQIILQACVSALAETIEQKCLAEDVVSSYRLNRDPKRLSFLEDQVDAWKKFQLKVQDKCSSNTCVLQIDIKSAYDSIDFDLFTKFLQNTAPNHSASGVLIHLLKSFSGQRGGLPFLNDTVFFLGNAYFSEVDAIVKSHHYEFVRFVDDYRIFGHSASDLEIVLSALRADLKTVGFEINEQKLKLGTGEEYLEAVSKLKYATTPATDYHDASDHRDLFDPTDMFAQILATLRNPAERLHQGFGRLQMADLRRMRARSLFAEEQGGAGAYPEEQFNELLSENSEALKLIANLLDNYGNSPTDTWRLVWILYLCKSLDADLIGDTSLKSRIFNSLEKISRNAAIDPIGRLWATKATVNRTPAETQKAVEQIHALQYQEAGRIWHGL